MICQEGGGTNLAVTLIRDVGCRRFMQHVNKMNLVAHLVF